MALVPPTKDNDWVSVRQAVQKIASARLGPDSTPTFAGISITGNATVSTLDAVSATISAGTFVSLYAQSFTCLSATISAGTFNSVDLGKAYSSSFVVLSATVSAGVFNSIDLGRAYSSSLVALSAVVSAGTFTSLDFTNLAGISATISSFNVISTNINHSDLNNLHQSIISTASPYFAGLGINTAAGISAQTTAGLLYDHTFSGGLLVTSLSVAAAATGGGGGHFITIRADGLATADYFVSQITTNANWYARSFATIVPATASKAWFKVLLNAAAGEKTCGIAAYSAVALGSTTISTYGAAHFLTTQVAGVNFWGDVGPIGISSGYVATYGTNTTFTTLQIYLTAWAT